MDYYQVETKETQEPGDWSPGKTRPLFRCQIRLHSGEDEETLFLVGPDSSSQVMALWKEANFGVLGAEPLAWIELEYAQEPDVYRRLLVSFLQAVRQADTASLRDFAAIQVHEKGLLPEADIREVFAKAFAGWGRALRAAAASGLGWTTWRAVPTSNHDILFK